MGEVLHARLQPRALAVWSSTEARVPAGPDRAVLVWAWFGIPKGPTREQTTFPAAVGIDVRRPYWEPDGWHADLS